MTARPPARLRHLAMRVQDLQACESFYTDVMGMKAGVLQRASRTGCTGFVRRSSLAAP
jgi:catechol 2,3-dioxygenase-like lactoylglutathione lyase family enzyme